MKLTALMPARNEEWVIGLSLRAALQWVDEVIVLAHACTDKTISICRKADKDRVIVSEDDNSTWDEMTHRQRMLETARKRGATHIAIIDADEVLTANLVPAMRKHVAALTPGTILQLPGYNLRGGVHQYHSTGIWSNRWFSVAFLDTAQLRWSGDRFHHRDPMGMTVRYKKLGPHGMGGMMHLWGADERRLTAKHALYKITERIRWPEKPVQQIDRLYNLAITGQPGDAAASWKYAAVPLDWWRDYRDIIEHLNMAGEPWQEAECQRLIEKHGAETFADLDLFGVVKEAVAA
jgi:hypothetical protein